MPCYHRGVKNVVQTQEFPSPEQPIFSQQPTQPLVDQVVEPISDLVDPTLLSESDPDVIEPMSSLVNPTLPTESDFDEAVESISVSINPCWAIGKTHVLYH